MLTLDTDIKFLKGVGEKRALRYNKLGIETVGNLIRHFPRNYLDLSSPYLIEEAPINEFCTVRARLISKGKEQYIRAGLSIFKLIAEDDSGEMQITIFNAKYTVDNLKLDEIYLFYGKINHLSTMVDMQSPEIYSPEENQRLLPIYPQTKGLSSRMIRQNIEQALNVLPNQIDPIPEYMLKELELPELLQALLAVHLPESLQEAKEARNRFIFEELLVLSLALSTLHNQQEIKKIEPMQSINLDEFLDSLPFKPTVAQVRCIEESTKDMLCNTPMNRLLQGDVGSGKTLVVAACIYFAYKNNKQSAVMVPTEILAEQHFNTFNSMLKPFGVNVALLTGSTKSAEKRRILSGLESGEINICVGTHALLSQGVKFTYLQLVITDEQHRFGVAQRVKLTQKSENCHVMVLSATPIPRTLSLIIYGDLKLSTIDELPPGRQPIETLVINSSKRKRALSFIKKALEQNMQAYIVCPLIEQGEIDMGLTSAIDYSIELAENELKGCKVGLLHGKMKPAEKEATMRRFKSGVIQVLVSTTVVEVGVDVPNATIILIENAERFGLSQLHQLRGRVGRGSEKSYCILVSDLKSSKTKQRLDVMKTTNDGFVIAEHDLALRGPGDFLGYRQHGLPNLQVANLLEDISIMKSAQQYAELILKKDSSLSLPEHKLLQKLTNSMLKSVGERPN